MFRQLHALWADDAGALIATEYLFLATILIIGIVVGLSSVRDAVNTEMAELANGILALSQGYTVFGVTGCCSETQGSQAIDTPGLVPEIVPTPNQIPSIIDQLPGG